MEDKSDRKRTLNAPAGLFDRVHGRHPITHLGIVHASQLILGYSGYTLQQRKWVLEELERGKRIMTAIIVPDGKGDKKLELGIDVYPIPQINPQFLRTDPNHIFEDNLGNLPSVELSIARQVPKK